MNWFFIGEENDKHEKVKRKTLWFCYRIGAIAREIYDNLTITRYKIRFRLAPDLQNMPSNQPASNWSMETGYDDSLYDDVTTEPYPHRIFTTGKLASFKVILRVLRHDIDDLCGGSVKGFKVKFHPPNENPQMWKKYFLVSPGRTVFYTIIPKVIESANNIRKFSPDVRQCYFDSERQLRFYKIYTQQNCEMECLSNFTLKQCGCVIFSELSKNFAIYPKV